jgi:hypothetical protein
LHPTLVITSTTWTTCENVLWCVFIFLINWLSSCVWFLVPPVVPLSRCISRTCGLSGKSQG